MQGLMRTAAPSDGQCVGGWPVLRELDTMALLLYGGGGARLEGCHTCSDLVLSALLLPPRALLHKG